ncbi:hypothetical protein PENTCL1PPCAC_5354, partial [Pristionchus entomophagus]
LIDACIHAVVTESKRKALLQPLWLVRLFQPLLQIQLKLRQVGLVCFIGRSIVVVRLFLVIVHYRHGNGDNRSHEQQDDQKAEDDDPRSAATRFHLLQSVTLLRRKIRCFRILTSSPVSTRLHSEVA